MVHVVCDTCLVQPARFQCTGCSTALYCSPACQTVDYATHGHRFYCQHLGNTSAHARVLRHVYDWCVALGWPTHLADPDDIAGYALFRETVRQNPDLFARLETTRAYTSVVAEPHLRQLVWACLTRSQQERWRAKRIATDDATNDRAAFDRERQPVLEHDIRDTATHSDPAKDSLLRQVWRNLISEERGVYVDKARHRAKKRKHDLPSPDTPASKKARVEHVPLTRVEQERIEAHLRGLSTLRGKAARAVFHALVDDMSYETMLSLMSITRDWHDRGAVLWQQFIVTHLIECFNRNDPDQSAPVMHLLEVYAAAEAVIDDPTAYAVTEWATCSVDDLIELYLAVIDDLASRMGRVFYRCARILLMRNPSTGLRNDANHVPYITVSVDGTRYPFTVIDDTTDRGGKVTDADVDVADDDEGEDDDDEDSTTPDVVIDAAVADVRSRRMGLMKLRYIRNFDFGKEEPLLKYHATAWWHKKTTDQATLLDNDRIKEAAAAAAVSDDNDDASADNDLEDMLAEEEEEEDEPFVPSTFADVLLKDGGTPLQRAVVNLDEVLARAVGTKLAASVPQDLLEAAAMFFLQMFKRGKRVVLMVDAANADASPNDAFMWALFANDADDESSDDDDDDAASDDDILDPNDPKWDEWNARDRAKIAAKTPAQRKAMRAARRRGDDLSDEELVTAAKEALAEERRQNALDRKTHPTIIRAFHMWLSLATNNLEEYDTDEVARPEVLAEDSHDDNDTPKTKKQLRDAAYRKRKKAAAAAAAGQAPLVDDEPEVSHEPTPPLPVAPREPSSPLPDEPVIKEEEEESTPDVFVIPQDDGDSEEMPTVPSILKPAEEEDVVVIKPEPGEDDDVVIIKREPVQSLAVGALLSEYVVRHPLNHLLAKYRELSSAERAAHGAAIWQHIVQVHLLGMFQKRVPLRTPLVDAILHMDVTHKDGDTLVDLYHDVMNELASAMGYQLALCVKVRRFYGVAPRVGVFFGERLYLFSEIFTDDNSATRYAWRHPLMGTVDNKASALEGTLALAAMQWKTTSVDAIHEAAGAFFHALLVNLDFGTRMSMNYTADNLEPGSEQVAIAAFRPSPGDAAFVLPRGHRYHNLNMVLGLLTNDMPRFTVSTDADTTTARDIVPVRDYVPEPVLIDIVSDDEDEQAWDALPLPVFERAPEGTECIYDTIPAHNVDLRNGAGPVKVLDKALTAEDCTRIHAIANALQYRREGNYNDNEDDAHLRSTVTAGPQKAILREILMNSVLAPLLAYLRARGAYLEPATIPRLEQQVANGKLGMTFEIIRYRPDSGQRQTPHVDNTDMPALVFLYNQVVRPGTAPRPVSLYRFDERDLDFENPMDVAYGERDVAVILSGVYHEVRVPENVQERDIVVVFFDKLH
jgi:hypothetical protein